MAMPEAAMHEDSDPIPGQDHIRGSGKVTAMDPEAVTSGEQSLPDPYFRFCVLTSDFAHNAAALSWRPIVHGKLHHLVLYFS
jgi:hypothetical protein